MHWRMAIFSLFVAPVLFAQPANDNDYAGDEALLREQRLPTKGAELLTIFASRTPKAATIEEFKKHVERLKASSYLERTKASVALRNMGPVVRPLLETLILDAKAEPETANRLREVLDHFPAEKDFAVVSAASRLLVRDKPANGLPTLLDFAPYATSEFVRQDLQRAINALAKLDKSPAAELLDSLKSPQAARRAAAAEAILRAGGLPAKEKIAALLLDAHPLVRHQLGMALVDLYDPTGLPMLIKSMGDTTAERAEFALEVLYQVAGEKAPGDPYQGPHKAAAFCAAWEKWFDANKGRLDLAKLDRDDRAGMGPRLTVLAMGGVFKKGGIAGHKILALGPDNAVRWEFTGPRTPLDVQIIGPNRLLIAEYSDRRVTERDFKGNVLWQAPAMLPIACQRLPNGHTFIVTRQKLSIVDRAGTELFAHPANAGSIMAAQRLRNGQIVMITTGNRCALLNPQGTEIKSFQLPAMTFLIGANLDVLPNGRVLVPIYNQNTVAEYDWSGNKHWSANVQLPLSVSRLKNGHTLVTSSVGNRVVELDEMGKEVWSYQADSRVYRARRR